MARRPESLHKMPEPLSIDEIFVVSSGLFTCKKYGAAAQKFIEDLVKDQIGWKRESYEKFLEHYKSEHNLWDWMMTMKHFQRHLEYDFPFMFVQQYHLRHNKMPVLEDWTDDPEYDEASNFSDAIASFKPLSWPPELVAAPAHVKCNIYDKFYGHMSKLTWTVSEHHQIARRLAYSTGV